MPVGSNDLGKVSDTTTDLLTDVKELSRELNRVNSEIDRAQRKNQQLSPELEKRQKELAALYNQAKTNLLQSSGRALLSPQASKEVQAEAKKVIDGELRQIQQKLARTILSGGRVDSVLVGQQSQLQSILNAYESRGQTQGQAGQASPGSRVYGALRSRLTGGPSFGNAMDAAFAMRGRARQTLGLVQNISRGQFDWRDAMDVNDAAELGSGLLKWGGRGLQAWGAKGALGTAGSWTARAASSIGGVMGRAAAGLGATAEFMATPAGMAMAAVPVAYFKILNDISQKTAEIKRSTEGAKEASFAKWGRDRVPELRRMLMQEKSIAFGQERLDERQKNRFELLARLAGNKDYKIEGNLTGGYGDAAVESAVAIQHLVKFLSKAERNYNTYSDAVTRSRGGRKGLDTSSEAALSESVVQSLNAGDTAFAQGVGNILSQFDEIDTAQEKYNRETLAGDKQLRWQMRYQERVLAEVEKQTLLSKQDWSRR